MMASKVAKGEYRTSAAGSREAEAYVSDGTVGSFVPESTYRDRRYTPAFDTLPLKD